MPSLHDSLQALSLRTTRPWAHAGGFANWRNAVKKDIVAFLLENPASIPQDVRDNATPGPDRNRRLQDRIDGRNNGILDRAGTPQLRLADVEEAFAPRFQRLEDLLARLATDRAGRAEAPAQVAPVVERPAQQGEEPLPFPAIPAIHPSAVADTARAIAPHVPAAMMEQLLQNRLDVREFWKLDESRSEEISETTSSEGMTKLQRLLGVDEEETSEGKKRSRSRYQNLESILRPWIVFCQIRNCLSPGAATYLLGHASELCRLNKAYPGCFAALLEYHIKVVRTFLNRGANLDMADWLETHPRLLEKHFHPYRTVAKTSNAAAGPSTQSSSFSPSTTGSLTSTQACRKWNNRESCPGNACRYRHMCDACGANKPRGHDGCKPLPVQHQSALTPIPHQLRPSAPSLLAGLCFGPIPPARPNTSPANGFSPAGPTPSALGGSLQSVLLDWIDVLSDYPEPAFPRLLAAVIRNGATLGTPVDIPPIHVDQYSSAPAQSRFLSEEVARRLTEGEVRIVDPSFPLAVTSLAAVPKERTKFRAIHDLRPVNDHVPKEFGYIAYSYVTDLFAFLRSAPRGCFLWKTDLANAFRHIRLCSSAVRLTGFAIGGTMYVDLCLPFGSRIAPFTFNLLAEAFHWVVVRAGTGFTLHYLDDFFGACETAPLAARAIEIVQLAASSLGIRINRAKCEGPATRMIILGIEIDTVAMEARLDDARRTRMVDDITGIIRRGTCSRLELEQITGLLQFACQVIPLGRVFVRRLYDAITSLPARITRRRLSSEAKKDLEWWLKLLAEHNGIRLLQPPPQQNIEVWTDASGTLGAGGHVGPVGSVTAAFRYSFPARHEGKTILWKELHAVLSACDRYSSSWSNCHVLFHVDNQAAVAAINSGSIRQESSQALVRRLWMTAAIGGWTFSSSWLASGSNALADAISRQDWARLYRLDPLCLALIPESSNYQSALFRQFPPNSDSPFLRCPTSPPTSSTSASPPRPDMDTPPQSGTTKLSAAAPAFLPLSRQ